MIEDAQRQAVGVDRHLHLVVAVGVENHRPMAGRDEFHVPRDGIEQAGDERDETVALEVAMQQVVEPRDGGVEGFAGMSGGAGSRLRASGGDRAPGRCRGR